ncbi:Androgen-induced gene 1 protein [Eumeta japonica]|uniref:Androgen-induced gene 1 protein n=1 Tax=Eumeta variegata TaxID=151549 RepID=A0A4C1X8V9_EUMVA|nr:Androgen-induced gene 1 protein [Eumeta japonica]
MSSVRVQSNAKVFSGVDRNALDFRICFYALCFIHHSHIAMVLLQIDFESHEDPKIRMYDHGKWKLFTTWFNLLYLAYFPLSLCCDMFERVERPLKYLGKFRNELFTTILFPATLYADAMFWRVWTIDTELIAPKGVDPLIPWYSQYSMHVVSLVVAVVDLLVVPRARPKSMVPGLALNTVFIVTYGGVTCYDIAHGMYIYPLLKRFSSLDLLLFLLYSIISNYFFYTLQWCIVDVVWKKKDDTKKKNYTSKQSTGYYAKDKCKVYDIYGIRAVFVCSRCVTGGAAHDRPATASVGCS